MNRKYFKKLCNICHKEKYSFDFYKNPSSKDGIRPSCKQCQKNRDNKKFDNINCIICGESFTPISKVSKYCCKKCKYISELRKRSNKPLFKICKQCELKFKPYTSLDKYCCANCRIQSEKDKRSFNWSKDKCLKITGKNNPSFRNGLYCRSTNKTSVGERIFIRNRKSIISEMKSNKGYVYCEYCNTSNSLRFEGHHIVYRSEKPLHKNLHDKNNIIVLCISCHNKFHKDKGIRNEIVKTRGLNTLFGNDVLNK